MAEQQKLYGAAKAAHEKKRAEIAALLRMISERDKEVLQRLADK